MATNFDKFDKSMDLDSLKNDIKNAASDSDYPEVPHGTYAVEITKLELTVSKKDQPMVTCWMKIVDGEHKGSTLFMNQVVTQGFQIHIANKFLRDLVQDMDMSVEFESYSQYAELLLDIHEAIEKKREYDVEYGERKGFNTFKIKEAYDLD